MITFTYSTMGGGKTTKLLQDHYNLAQLIDCRIFKPALDTRDKTNEEGVIQSRLIKQGTPCTYTDTLCSQLPTLYENKIFLDEVQFFDPKDLKDFLLWCIKTQKDVYAYGLKTDCNCDLFEGVKPILALADEIIELKNFCVFCGAKATAHLRYSDGVLITNGSPIQIEGEDITYNSVCNDCWLRHTLKANTK